MERSAKRRRKDYAPQELLIPILLPAQSVTIESPVVPGPLVSLEASYSFGGIRFLGVRPGAGAPQKQSVLHAQWRPEQGLHGKILGIQPMKVRGTRGVRRQRFVKRVLPSPSSWSGTLGSKGFVGRCVGGRLFFVKREHARGGYQLLNLDQVVRLEVREGRSPGETTVTAAFAGDVGATFTGQSARRLLERLQERSGDPFAL